MAFFDSLKKYKWWLLSLLALLVLFSWWYTTRATYPDIYTPKPPAGNPEAAVTIVEFSDFQCPACGTAYPVVQQILKEYGDRIRFEYKQFPLTSIHRFAFKAAEASECANDQGKFWEYGDLLFTHQKALTTNDLKNYAEQLVMDPVLFENCLDSSAKAKYVNADFNEGIGKNVQGTPTFFINGQKLESWKYESFQSAIESALGAGEE